MSRMRRAAGLAILGLLAAAPAGAAPPVRDPDWPCQQIKVPEISAASIWTGPPLDAARQAWASDPDVADLARRLAQRRIPLDQAEREVAAFASRMREEKAAKLTELFAGIFTILDRERSTVIDGLDRYGRRQKQLADELRALVAQWRDAQSAATPDATRAQQIADQVAWSQRVFDERRQSLSYACNVPATIEQRIFALGRAIQKSLS